MPSRSTIAIICLLAAVAIAYFLIWPKYQGFQAAQNTIQEKQEQLQTKKDYFAQLHETEKRLEENEESLSKMKEALPEEYSLPDLYKYFRSTASQTGLVLGSISGGGGDSSKVKEKEEEKGLQEVSFQLSLAGSYSAFKNFLSEIEKSARIFEVKSISFDSPSGEGVGEEEEDEDTFSFSVNLVTFINN